MQYYREETILCDTATFTEVRQESPDAPEETLGLLAETGTSTSVQAETFDRDDDRDYPSMHGWVPGESRPLLFYTSLPATGAQPNLRYDAHLQQCVDDCEVPIIERPIPLAETFTKTAVRAESHDTDDNY